MNTDAYLDELDQSLDVVKAQVERSNTDSEVDVWRSFRVIVDDLQHVVGRLTAFRNEGHGVRHGRRISRQVTDVERRRVSETAKQRFYTTADRK